MLVTGATGFIGQHLVRRLTDARARIWAGVHAKDAPERITALPLQAERLFLDVRDAESVRQAVNQASPDVVFHLAAVGVTDPNVDPRLALKVNGVGAVNLLESLLREDVQRIVLVGTCYEYGALEALEGLDPLNAYAASKVAAWAFGRMYWRAHGLPVVTVRPFQVYGSGQPSHTLIPAAVAAALAGEDFPMTSGEQERDFIYVEDVVEGMLAAAQASGVEGSSLDLGTGTARPIRTVVERIWQLVDGAGQIQPGALPYRPGAVRQLVANADRTAELTGWRATTDLDEGLRETIAELREAR